MNDEKGSASDGTVVPHTRPTECGTTCVTTYDVTCHVIFSTPRDAHSRAAPPASPLVGVARFLRVRTRHCLRQLAQGQPAQQEDLPEPEVDRLALLCRDAAAVDSACRVDEVVEDEALLDEVTVLVRQSGQRKACRRHTVG